MSVSIRPDNLGDLVSAIGAPHFGAHYFKLFSDVLAIDQCTVFAFTGAAPPDSMVVESKNSERKEIANALARDYIAGGFNDDPNVKRLSSADSPTVHCLRADEVSDRFYKLRFYDEPCLAHEIVLLGRSQGTLYYSSFYRSDRLARFGARELELLHELAGFAVKALHRHHELIGVGTASSPWLADSADTLMSPEKRRRLLDHLCEVLLAEPYKLSRREAQVCAGIVLGHTTVGISLNLGISVSTVATHRKRAYSKLGICSQNELFSRYFRVVNQRQLFPIRAVA